MNHEQSTDQPIFSLGVSSATKERLESALRRRLAGRNWRQHEWPTFIVSPDSAQFADLPTSLQDALHEALRAYDQIWVKEETARTRFPFLDRIKSGFHQLTIFYVNKLGRKQIDFNDYLLRVIQELVSVIGEQNRQIVGLQDQLQARHATHESAPDEERG